MKHKRQIVPVVIGIFFCSLVFCMAMLCAGGYAFTPLSLPVYKMEQIDSVYEGYRRTTITSGNTVYVQDYEEYALGSVNSAPTEMIGRFPNFWGLGTGGVYAIPGQDPSAYVLEWDPIYQQVYRNIDHPPFDWRSAHFNFIRLMIPTANPKESEDPLLIEEILSVLKNGVPIVVPMRSDGDYSETQNYTLLLFSDELPGMMYMAGVHVTDSAEVYLAENIISNQWNLAGPLFIEFIRN